MLAEVANGWTLLLCLFLILDFVFYVYFLYILFR